MKKQKESEEIVLMDAYSLFVYAVRTQITRDYYLRRLRTFFDFIKLLPNSWIENRYNHFAAIAIKDHDWTFGKIIGFLQKNSAKNRVKFHSQPTVPMNRTWVLNHITLILCSTRSVNTPLELIS